jgi:subtilisin family serine protease
VSDPAYALKAGTSMATPHAAGLAAIAWTASPDATPLQIRQAILRTARARGAAGTRGTSDGAGMISGVNLIDEARTAPGIKIVSPRYGTTAASQIISAKIEARDEPITWSMRYVGSPAGDVDVSSGVAFGSGGSVSAKTTVTVTEPFVAPATGSYLVILEADAGGRSYYDVTLLNAP